MISLNKLIYDFVDKLSDKDITPLIDLLWNKENVSEFKLADKLETTVNLVRNMLYKLHSKGLVWFIRKKDKRKGWYIYYWTFDLKKALELLIIIKGERIKLLEVKLNQRQIDEYFSCPNKCVTFKYSTAMEYDFKCPECGNILKRLDVRKQIAQIKKEIKILYREVEDSKIYLREEIDKIEKKKIRAEKRALKKRTKKVKRKGKKRGRKKKIKKKIKKKGKKKVKKKGRKKKIKKRKIKKKTKRKRR